MGSNWWAELALWVPLDIVGFSAAAFLRLALSTAAVGTASAVAGAVGGFPGVVGTASAVAGALKGFLQDVGGPGGLGTTKRRRGG